MRMQIRSTLVILGFLGCGTVAWAQSQRVQIIDAQGFGRPVVAGTVQIPAGWQVRGGVNWDRRTPCVTNQVRVEWQAASPDGQQVLEIMHGFGWQVQGAQFPTNPCPVLPLRSARDFLTAVVQQRRAGAQFVAYRNRPDLVAKARASAPPSPGPRPTIDAGELEISYAYSGATVREVLSTTVTFSEFQGYVAASTPLTYAYRAPQEEFDPQLGRRISASLKPDPQWLSMADASIGEARQRFHDAQRQQTERWHAKELERINAQGAADRAAIWAQTRREIGEIQSRTYDNTRASDERMQRRRLEAIGGYDTYRDSSGNPVTSSHDGNRVLREADGSYTSPPDRFYNPAGSEELERVR